MSYTLDPHMSGKPLSPCGINLNLLTNYVMVPELSFYFSCAISGGAMSWGILSYSPDPHMSGKQVMQPSI